MLLPKKIYVSVTGPECAKYHHLVVNLKPEDKRDFEFIDGFTIKHDAEEHGVKQQIRTRLESAKVFLILICDQKNNADKLNLWETEVALELDVPIVGINLNGSRRQDALCPSRMRDQLAVYVSFEPKIIIAAIGSWPLIHGIYRRDHKSGPCYFADSTYDSLV
jgi:hypothetical protein